MKPLRIAFFGSSLVSAYWNGAATYYRGIIRNLSARGHSVTFFEPDAYNRQEHRDYSSIPWANVQIYSGADHGDLLRALERAHNADLIVKCSGVGVWDELLDREVARLSRPQHYTAYWDVDAPATLARVHANPADPFRGLIPAYDLIFTYGGGDRVVTDYGQLGARRCVPIYNALDPATHFPAPPDLRYRSALSFLGNRLPDREQRVDEFFFRAASLLSKKSFLLGGSGWDDKYLPPNVRYCGHVYTCDHNAFNCSALTVLNIDRESMAACGFSPPTRIFEAAGAGACIITDEWAGIESFLDPDSEILLAASGAEVAEKVLALTPATAREIGARARRRMLSAHTYQHRVEAIEAALDFAR